MLASIDLEPDELRRLRADLMFYIKILNNSTQLDPDETFIIYTPMSVLSSRSGSSYLQKPVKATDVSSHTLFYRRALCQHCARLRRPLNTPKNQSTCLLS